ncbi:class I SAM-dependent RNA methyltransferase [Aureimonas jatrophae]|uniref:23S rRNA m(5)U-1939 methyltransferase n=1 Tax=Aureimonas jatrophae TaxID=1166073 RepID=A0A1H0GMM1_9HYPH|nr:class I SAM-dependent RNA methyltransferase [Aureimonas jatrophae]MBB3949653.1 23S rRNA (uracil1939-C5)-methyltransferase [Aureimonas jatrophae]SDO08147.1 23S rRNA m(5)U-1939 methyltransferase [Aureimonas jatrophae]
MSAVLTIESLGQQGDGFARTEAGPVHVPLTLPGERIRADTKGSRGRLVELVERSPDRVDAPCPHFGRCGGCELQHADDRLYAAFKRDRVVTAFRREGLTLDVEDLVRCPRGSRRRAVFSAVRAGPRVLFGFHEANSNRVAPIETCLIAVPAIVRALPELATLAPILIDRKRELRLTVTAAENGLDVAVEAAADLNARNRLSAIEHAVAAGWTRLTIDGEIAVQSAPPQILFDGIAVEPPPGAFLQAVAESEAAMARLVVEHLRPARAVADLFSGVGTFAARLARDHAVHAVESDAAALTSLDRAQRTPQGLKAITIERRDLFRRPLTIRELNRFGGVVFDPPRAGAEAVSRELSQSEVPLVAAVSCNPTTLARDARLLIDGGYRLKRIVPIDQFLWTHHVEVVALFER